MSKKPIKIIIEKKRGFAEFNLAELWEYRDVAWMLATRDIKLRYKQTALGVVWVILQPLSAGIIFAVIFGHFAKMPSDGKPYVLFVMTGLLAWNLFSGAIQRAGNSLVTDSKLITKVYFPRILVPLASTVAVLVDFIVSLIVLIILMLYYGVSPGLEILTLPLWLLLTVLLGTGVSLWLSAINVKYRDFMYAMPFLIQLWMYATPVVYASSLIPEKWRWIFALNPMVGIIEGFRWSILGSSGLTLTVLVTSVAMALGMSLAGVFYFKSVEREFADYI